MNFFEHQSTAKKRTGFLVIAMCLAVTGMILALYAALALFYTFSTDLKLAAGETPFQFKHIWYPEALLYSALGFIGLFLVTAMAKTFELQKGGLQIAVRLGGRVIPPSSNTFYEKRLLNIVEEMAIASGVPVPVVVLLEEEESINAFAAGMGLSDAVIGVTRGCMELLTRDELQGVIAHEFSHILNGDMRLNIRLMAIVHGILVIYLAGRTFTRVSVREGRHIRRRGFAHGESAILFLGFIVTTIGYIGVLSARLIKSAISREREYLADASAVQFTRNPGGISGALKKIGGLSQHAYLKHKNAEEMSHFFFANALTESFFQLFATHPPLHERISRIDPSFRGHYPLVSFEDKQSSHALEQSESFEAAERIQSFHSSAFVSGAKEPEKAHLSYAAKLIHSIPKELSALCHDTYGARALIYALLLHKDAQVRDRQYRYLAVHADGFAYRETIQAEKWLLDINPHARLPLADLATPSLRGLSKALYEVFRTNIQNLIQMDEHCELFEYVVQRTLIRHLDIHFGKKQKAAASISLTQATPHIKELLLSLCLLTNADSKAAQKAFQAGISVLPEKDREMDFMKKYNIASLEMALSHLERASLETRKKVIEACATCISADGVVEISEAELLRAIAESIDYPLPPFLEKT